jgi:hypothetical protein
MTTEISDLYFNYVAGKKDNIKYYAFAISRENTDSIMIKYVLYTSDSNVEAKVAYQKGLSEISWKGFHVREESQSIEICTENCAALNSMLDPNGKVPGNESFYFILYKVSQIDETYQRTFLKMLRGQLTNNYEIINYEISDVDVEEKNVPDEIERWKKKVAGDRAIQKALATAIDTAKQMKLKIDAVERKNKRQHVREGVNLRKGLKKITNTFNQSGDANTSSMRVDKMKAVSNAFNQLTAKKEQTHGDNPPRRNSKTSPNTGSLLNIHRSQSNPDVLNVPQQQSPPESDPDSDSDSDSDLSIIELAEFGERSSSSTGDEASSSVGTDFSDDSSIVPNPNGEPDWFSTPVNESHTGPLVPY